MRQSFTRLLLYYFQTGSEYTQPIVRKKPNEDKRNPDDDGNASEGDFMSEAKVKKN